jgi:flagellin
MTTSTYKGKNVFVDNASSEYVSLGGRNAEMTFGIGKVSFTELYGTTARTIVGAPNSGASMNLTHLPSDAVVAKEYGKAAATVTTGNLLASSTYVIKGTLGAETNMDTAAHAGPAAIKVRIGAGDTTVKAGSDVSGATAKTAGPLAVGDVITTTTNTISITPSVEGSSDTANTYAQVRSDDNAFVKGETYIIRSLGTTSGATTAGTDGGYLKAASASLSSTTTLVIGQEFTVDSDATDIEMNHINSLVQGMTFSKKSDVLTKDIEAVQAKLNTARVQAGSQYAALESAIAYTTDLTAQYELGYNTVNDVNFSMETAHLAKNQILQQAATAMLAQANQGQQSLLQLIQG